MDWKDPVQVKEYRKRWRDKNKEKCNGWMKKWRDGNKDKVKGNMKEYRHTAQGIKVRRIHTWKWRGMICDDEWDEVYEWYQTTTNCDICDVSLQGVKRCLDHDHTIEGYNVRQVLCYSCNQFHNEL